MPFKIRVRALDGGGGALLYTRRIGNRWRWFVGPGASFVRYETQSELMSFTHEFGGPNTVSIRYAWDYKRHTSYSIHSQIGLEYRTSPHLGIALTGSVRAAPRFSDTVTVTGTTGNGSIVATDRVTLFQVHETTISLGIRISYYF